MLSKLNFISIQVIKAKMYWPIDNEIKKGDYEVSDFFAKAFAVVEKDGVYNSGNLLFEIVMWTLDVDMEVLRFLQKVEKIGELNWGNLLQASFARFDDTQDNSTKKFLNLPVIYYILSKKKDKLEKKDFEDIINSFLEHYTGKYHHNFMPNDQE